MTPSSPAFEHGKRERPHTPRPGLRPLANTYPPRTTYRVLLQPIKGYYPTCPVRRSAWAWGPRATWGSPRPGNRNRRPDLPRADHARGCATLDQAARQRLLDFV